MLELVNYYNKKQNEILYVNMENMDFLPPTAPNLVFARETCTPYYELLYCIVVCIFAKYYKPNKCHKLVVVVTTTNTNALYKIKNKIEEKIHTDIKLAS